MLLTDLVEASARVAATRSRTAKIAELSAVLESADTEELPIAVGFLYALARLPGPLR